MNEFLYNSKVLVTGATGLIGQALVKRLLSCGTYVVAVVRDIAKAEYLFGTPAGISYIVSDVTALNLEAMDVDYIVHAASNTSSKAFIEDPVGVVITALEGTRRTLEIARLSNVKGYVYLSSMEVYGMPVTDEKIDEEHSTNLDTMKVRSAYPESKRMCENLCASYCSQFGVHSKVLRLTQTFGPGVNYSDTRVFAEFAKCVIENRDIVLHTKGETKRCYLYTEDAVNAILTVLLKGQDGEAYNAANEKTYCSIYDMACLVADNCADGKIKVRVEDSGSASLGYAPTLHMNLDTRKLQKLDWKPTVGLYDMYKFMIAEMKGEV